MDHNFPPPPTTTQNQTESDRLLGIAEKLLQSRDLTGSREFALLAQETGSLSEGSDQILAITDVLLASEKRVNNNRHNDWYAVLQSDPLSEPDLLRKNYRRLALLLHPDKNKFPLADSAFKFVADAWAVLSDPSKRTPYDHELRRPQQLVSDKLPVRRSASGMMNVNENVNVHHSRGGKDRLSRENFWTTCPYCYVLYEYPNVYKECCVRCQNCERAFQAVGIPSMPPLVPGKEAYYCCWGFFPLGFSVDGKGKKADANNDNAGNVNTGFPNWMPGMFTTPQNHGANANANVNVNSNVGVRGVVDFSDGSGSGGFGNAMPGMSNSGAKKRGRPKKNPLGF